MAFKIATRGADPFDVDYPTYEDAAAELETLWSESRNGVESAITKRLEEWRNGTRPYPTVATVHDLDRYAMQFECGGDLGDLAKALFLEPFRIFEA